MLHRKRGRLHSRAQWAKWQEVELYEVLTSFCVTAWKQVQRLAAFLMRAIRWQWTQCCALVKKIRDRVFSLDTYTKANRSRGFRLLPPSPDVGEARLLFGLRHMRPSATIHHGKQSCTLETV